MRLLSKVFTVLGIILTPITLLIIYVTKFPGNDFFGSLFVAICFINLIVCVPSLVTLVKGNKGVELGLLLTLVNPPAGICYLLWDGLK